MLGLKRHTVRLVDHDPAWASLSESECRRLWTAGGTLIADVQHVGSTAVPGLPAKPILDTAVAVPSRETIPALVPCLTAIGYIDRGDAGGDGGYLLVKESAPGVRTVHVHVVEIADVQWRNYLGFRDMLRCDPAIRAEYAQVKKGLEARFQTDRRSYTANKNGFIRRVLAAHASVVGAQHAGVIVDLRSRLESPQVRELVDQFEYPEDVRKAKTDQILGEYRAHPDRPLVGVESDGDLVGLIGLRVVSSDAAVIGHLVVRRDRRRRGFGRQLVAAASRMYPSATITAETDRDAVEFYRRLGFGIESLGERYPGVERFNCKLTRCV